MVSQPLDKIINEQERLDVAAALVSEELTTTNQLVDTVASPANLPAPGLVEKLMQQLNDLKEMVYINVFI